MLIDIYVHFAGVIGLGWKFTSSSGCGGGYLSREQLLQWKGVDILIILHVLWWWWWVKNWVWIMIKRMLLVEQLGETCGSKNQCGSGLICQTCAANGNTRPRCTQIRPTNPTSKVRFCFQIPIIINFTSPPDTLHIYRFWVN